VSLRDASRWKPKNIVKFTKVSGGLRLFFLPEARKARKMTIKELLEKKLKIATEARSILNNADAENRELTSEEMQNHTKAMNDISDLNKQISVRQAQDSLELEMQKTAGRKSENNDLDLGNNRSEAIEIDFRGEKLTYKEGSQEHARSTPEARAAFNAYVRRGELRAAASFANDVDADGGYLHAPTQFVAQLIAAVDDNVIIRQLATVLPVTTSDSLGAPTLDTDMTDAAWTTEVSQITSDQSLQLGNRELKPQLLSKLVKISRKLFLTSAISPESLVRDRLAIKFAAAEENGFMTGDGSGKPLGVFTPSANGINTDRDVAGGNTATGIVANGLQAAKFALKAGYRKNANWIFHRDAVAAIAQLKDTNGRYIWQPGLQAGEPDTVLGIPLRESEYAPNTFTTGQYVGIVGDFSKYWIADLLALEVQRLAELYAAANQIGFIGRKYTDGAPVLGEAFARVTLG
jgi:HK97 family phage major capsid protein